MPRRTAPIGFAISATIAVCLWLLPDTTYALAFATRLIESSSAPSVGGPHTDIFVDTSGTTHVS